MGIIQQTHPHPPAVRTPPLYKVERVPGGDSPVVPVIILAAGPSSRLGQPKQLLQVKGETLIHRITRIALQSNTGPVVVVLGAQAEIIQNTIEDLPVYTCVHPDWHKGMGSSIKAGLHFVQKKFPDAPAIILSVCDQPFLEAGHFRKLSNTFRKKGGEIIASKYAKTFGVPCLFGKKFFSSLEKLRDDQGAKSVFEAYRNQTAFISFTKGEVDIDTLTDWKNVQNLMASKRN